MDKNDETILENDLAETAESSSEVPALSSAFGSARQVVDRYTHCSECGANLHFSHVTDFSRNLTQESAKCPECGTKGRQVIYRLQ